MQRGQGRRRRQPLTTQTIRIRLYRAAPTVTAWAARVSSLREITHDDVTAAVHACQGRRSVQLLSTLRSLFRALRQERIVFRDPTRGLHLPDNPAVPVPLPSDRLAGLLHGTTDPAVRLFIALIAVHALTRHGVRHLRLDDLDVARARLTVHRPGRTHTVYLDRTTYRLTDAWLRHRRHHWPATANPHLFVTGRTAHDQRRPPIAATRASVPLRRLGVSAERLRTDRILDEAAVSADPVRLIRLFGLSVTTAMRYIHAAHPHPAGLPPR